MELKAETHPKQLKSVRNTGIGNDLENEVAIEVAVEKLETEIENYTTTTMLPIYGDVPYTDATKLIATATSWVGYVKVGSVIYMSCYLLIIVLVCGKKSKEEREDAERWKALKQRIHENRQLYSALFLKK